jgi:hypothetical protein
MRISPLLMAALLAAGCRSSKGGAGQNGPDGSGADDPPLAEGGAQPAPDARDPSDAPVAGPLVGVLMHHNDLARTGGQLDEKILTPANVSVDTFGQLFCRPVDGEVWAQILYVAGVDFGPRGRRNAVYLVTSGDSAYAFDADSATEPALWEKHYADGTAGIRPPINEDFRIGGDVACGGTLVPGVRWGILGTPAIDPDAGTMYFVARTKEGTRFVQRLHAIALADGSERPGSPVEIAAQLPAGPAATGAAGGMISFDPLLNKQRMGLLLHDGIVYITWSCHCDWGPYHGWVIGYDARTLTQEVVYTTTPNGKQGGLWQSGQPPAVDDQGNLFLATGNGTVDIDGGPNRGESVLALRRSGNTLTVLDWFTPANHAFLEEQDRDLGSAGVLLVPGSTLVLAGGKDGRYYLLDRNNLGRLSANDDAIVQSLQVTARQSHFHGGPVYWKTDGREFVYSMAEEDSLRQYEIVGGKLNAYKVSPVMAPHDPAQPPGTYTMPGGFLSLSADGDRPGTGILWIATTLSMDANPRAVPGILSAVDATDVTRVLWSSVQNGARDDFGNFAKYNVPTVYAGKVYVPTFSGRFCVYGGL